MPSSADTETVEETVVDHARTALLEALQADLGDSLIEHVLVPGVDLTVRIAADSWGETAGYLREGQRFRFFDFLSAIDWLPSPFGRSMDAAVDTADDGTNEPAEIVTGVAGGDTRFQLFARVFSLTTNVGLTLKTDVGDDLTMQTWTGTYPGADWHEREVWEMFGINFAGHPGLRPLYLPTDFEGNPMRKDFPLLARMIKPWPGIVDVEPMPEPDAPDSPSTDNVEAAAQEAPTSEVVEAPAPETATPVPETVTPAAQTATEPSEAVAEAVPIEPDPTPEPVPPAAGEAIDTSGIPEHLLKRSREAKGDAS